MFEKFTQKAVDIVLGAQFQAISMNADRVYSEHLLLGLVSSLKGVQAKLMGVSDIDINELAELTKKRVINTNAGKKREFIPFSKRAQDILKKSTEIAKEYGKNSLVGPNHIALAILTTSNSGALEILKEFNFDEERVISNIRGVLAKKSKSKKFVHPEDMEESAQKDCFFKKVDTLFSEKSLSNLLSSAKAKLCTAGYEILGTEQIIQSVLDEDSEITKILSKYGITKENYDEKLKNISNREDEYGERRIIFTPNAFRVMLNTFETAKEMGSVEIKPEHVILGVLQAKTGIAYKILKELTGPKTDLIEKLTKELNTGTKTMPETLAILRLAHAECINLNKTSIGTEMILLGILAYKNGIAAEVLDKLGINLKDARCEVQKFLGDVVEDVEKSQIKYTERAKKLLEAAYEIAKAHGKQKIMSENILYAFTKIKDCVGMKILENLGTDALEIKQGILDEMKNIQI